MATLTLIAGPNGAGKTSLSSYFEKENLFKVKPVDIDGLDKLINEDKIPNDMLRYEKERRKEIHRIFCEMCDNAIKKGLDFAYECNLRKDQIESVGLFEEAGYKLNLVYMWLDNVELSEQRVQKRVKSGGHPVGKDSIHRNYEEGLENLDLTYEEWNELYVFDNSVDIDNNSNKDGTLLLFIKSGEVMYVSNQFIKKEGIKKKLPRIMKQITKQTNYK